MVFRRSRDQEGKGSLEMEWRGMRWGLMGLGDFYITLCKCKIYLVKYDTNLIEYV